MSGVEPGVNSDIHLNLTMARGFQLVARDVHVLTSRYPSMLMRTLRELRRQGFRVPYSAFRLVYLNRHYYEDLARAAAKYPSGTESEWLGWS